MRCLSLYPCLVLTLAACPSRDISKLDPLPAKEVYKEVPVSSNRKIDILFVVDNSDSMTEEQVNLATNFPRFIEVLDAIPGGRPDLHIGVVSSNVGISPYTAEACVGKGDDGELQNTPRNNPVGCTAPRDGARFIVDSPDGSGGRTTNYDGDLPDVLSCIANLGNDGCGLEQHLEAMKRALDPTYPASVVNAGFVRADAYLAVVILADEDDCSAFNSGIFDPDRSLDNISSVLGPFTSFRCTEFGVTCDGLPKLPREARDYTSCRPLSEVESGYLNNPHFYADFLRQLKGDPNLIAVAGIIAAPTPFGVFIDGTGAPALKNTCSTTGGRGDPGVRLNAFVDEFGRQSTTGSICDPDFFQTITDIANLVAEVIGTPCLADSVAPEDIDPDSPGRQLDCLVYDKNTTTSGDVETVIPRCDMVDDNTPVTTSVPCWWTNVDATACSTSETHLTLHVERGGADPPPTTRVVARCIAQ